MDKRICELMTKDLLKAEEFINTMGVETRTDEDEFISISVILKDVVKVANMNPTIIDDVDKNIGKIKTSDDLKMFLSRYKF